MFGPSSALVPSRFSRVAAAKNETRTSEFKLRYVSISGQALGNTAGWADQSSECGSKAGIRHIGGTKGLHAGGPLASRTDTTSSATWCGRALALSHARSGSSVLLSGYMGKSDTFDRAIADFSLAYADQAEKDHTALDRAVRKGKVKAVFEDDR